MSTAVINTQKKKEVEKRLDINPETKGISENFVSQIRKKQKLIFCKLKQVMESHDTDHDLNDSNRTLFDARDKVQTLPMGDDMSVQTNKRNNNNTIPDNYTCYRCKHFSDVPQNLSQPFCKGIPSFVGQCEADLTFVQAIVWLKSVSASVSQISIERLQQIFNKQWNISYRCNERKSKELLNISEKNSQHYKQNKHTDSSYRNNEHNADLHSEQLNHPVNKRLLHKEINTKDTSISSNLVISYSAYSTTSQISNYKVHANSRNVQNAILDFISVNNANEVLTDEPLTPERCTSYIIENKKRKESLSKLHIIAESDIESSDDIFESPNMLESSMKYQNNNECFEYEKDTRCLPQSSSKNYIEQVNQQITRNITASPSLFNCSYKNAFPIKEKHIIAPKGHKSVLLSKNQSIEANENYNLDEECFTPVASQLSSSHRLLLESENSSKNLLIQMDSISQLNNEVTFWKQNNSCSFDIDQTYSTILNSPNSNGIEIPIGDHSSEIWINNTAIENPTNDSAYSTSHIDIPVHDTITKPNCNKQRHCYELRSCEINKTITCDEVIDNPTDAESSSIIQNTKFFHKRRSSRKKHKSDQEQIKNVGERKKKRKVDMISTKCLNFILESSDTEYVILDSVKVILLTLGDEEIAKEYMIQRYWKDTMKEEAINAVLNISDIFRIEKKPNICKKEIVTIIIKTLDEVATCGQLNKTSMGLYRVQIILELCNSLPICIRVIDHLITKLKLFKSTPIDTLKVQHNMHDTVNQLHLIFYALNITLRKYRAIIPDDQRCRSVKNPIFNITDLWKTKYIDEELQDINLNFDIIEERWSHALEDFTVASTKHFMQFAEKSFLLARVLI